MDIPQYASAYSFTKKRPEGRLPLRIITNFSKCICLKRGQINGIPEKFPNKKQFYPYNRYLCYGVFNFLLLDIKSRYLRAQNTVSITASCHKPGL